ncbi:MAG: helix-turn-helix domain-containing protein [Planctomycetaceae bacterium]|nr:helix-turn-helix domain-containing protein [Planctomycetaceae bacterium]
MPNILKVLKEEITRLARKEVKAAAVPLQKETVRLKRVAASLKRRISALERQNRILHKHVATSPAAKGGPVDEKSLDRMRVTGKMMSRLRVKLGLTQADFGRLLGVSGQQVYQYERKEGSLRLRKETRAMLAKARQMGKREARSALGQK